jgi:N-ethylmaleimide reductase
VVAEFAQAARNAIAAGFDGVELHCTSGYLPMQFMATGSNQRSDEYGGSLANRVRFPVECLAAMAEAIGPGRVGLRMNPGNTYNDILTPTRPRPTGNSPARPPPWAWPTCT